MAAACQCSGESTERKKMATSEESAREIEGKIVRRLGIVRSGGRRKSRRTTGGGGVAVSEGGGLFG